jgi:rhomboid family GlyGly-CTERM serine protease
LHAPWLDTPLLFPQADALQSAPLNRRQFLIVLPISLRQWRDFIPHWSLLLVLLISGSMVLSSELTQLLRYDRGAVLQGQWWRLFTANLVHSNGWHFLLNLSSVWVQAILFRDLTNARTWTTVSVLCAFGNLLGMHYFSLNLNWYVGMSGALYGIAIFGAMALLRNREWLVGGVLAAYLTGRILYERFFELSDELAHLINAPVATDAHLFGLLTGYSCSLLLFMKWTSLSNKPLHTEQN